MAQTRKDAPKSEDEWIPEADIESVTLTNLRVPGNIVIREPIVLDSESTVESAIRNIIVTYELRLQADQCTLVVIDSQGQRTWLNKDDSVEDVADHLISYSHIEIVSMQEDATSTSLGDLGVKKRQ